MKTVMVRSVRTLWHRRHQGSAALITTIAISAILVVLFVGITSIATREIRQSVDADNANRALYAAEAGVEDAIRRLGEDPNLKEPTCNALASPQGAEVKVLSNSAAIANAPDTAWTCRTISYVSKEVTGELQRDQSITLNLGRARTSEDPSAPYTTPYFMLIEWNNKSEITQQLNPGGIRAPWSWLPSTSSGQWKGPAALEISATWMNTSWDGVSATRAYVPIAGKPNVLPVRTVLASPVWPTTESQYKDFSTFRPPTGSGLLYTTPPSNVTVKCTDAPSDEYSCSMPASGGAGTGAYKIQYLLQTEINDGTIDKPYTTSSSEFEKQLVFLRIKPRYNTASYRIRFFDKFGKPVYVPDGNATIDVTARSGSYFRRVVAKKKLAPTTTDGVFDNALFSGKDICKTLEIYRDYRGAPQKLADGSDNPNAGRNTGCQE